MQSKPGALKKRRLGHSSVILENGPLLGVSADQIIPKADPEDSAVFGHGLGRIPRTFSLVGDNGKLQLGNEFALDG